MCAKMCAIFFFSSLQHNYFIPRCFSLHHPSKYLETTSRRSKLSGGNWDEGKCVKLSLGDGKGEITFSLPRKKKQTFCFTFFSAFDFLANLFHSSASFRLLTFRCVFDDFYFVLLLVLLFISGT